MAIAYTPYSSAAPYFSGAAPSGVFGIDVERVRAYEFYEQIYWNHPETWRVKARGNNAAPIYLPSPKKITEATNRFLGLNFDFVVSATTGTPDARMQVRAKFIELFKREQFWTKYLAQKRWGLVRGDAIWHITADPKKAEGKRISLHDVHPSRYFPIFDPNDDQRKIGAHLVDVVKDPNDENKQCHRVQTYRKVTAPDDPTFDEGAITSEQALFELGKWDDRNMKPSDIKKIAQLVAPFQLPPAITTIPVYHIRNTWDSAFAYGSSILRGVETVHAAANQAISDADLALAFNGLGMYWTDAAPPVDEGGKPTAWPMGPGLVAEVPYGRQMGRLSGIDNMSGALEHVKFVLDEAQTGAGVPDLAAGKVDVTTAESGIALRLQLSPILAANEERERALLDTYDHMLYDLSRQWFPAYENFQEGLTCEVASVVEDPLPQDEQSEIDRIVALVGAKIISPEEARLRLVKLGWKLDDGGLDQIVQQEQQLAQARDNDEFANRFRSELDAMSGNVGTGTLRTPAQGTGTAGGGSGAVSSSANGSGPPGAQPPGSAPDAAGG